ncbi:hypothetical protein EYF80_053510 [Liparis tanakae]|uniref:Uncharacterized protein n=1 Tax=Liparis tanakae TaxID=230148 RepID=A0A4Z2F5E3_9TELE|nr:hypothetical protein EYF80_053510 [Liparis tanakae]
MSLRSGRRTNDCLEIPTWQKKGGNKSVKEISKVVSVGGLVVPSERSSGLPGSSSSTGTLMSWNLVPWSFTGVSSSSSSSFSGAVSSLVSSAGLRSPPVSLSCLLLLLLFLAELIFPTLRNLEKILGCFPDGLSQLSLDLFFPFPSASLAALSPFPSPPFSSAPFSFFVFSFSAPSSSSLSPVAAMSPTDFLLERVRGLSSSASAFLDLTDLGFFLALPTSVSLFLLPLTWPSSSSSEGLLDSGAEPPLDPERTSSSSFTSASRASSLSDSCSFLMVAQASWMYPRMHCSTSWASC